MTSVTTSVENFSILVMSTFTKDINTADVLQCFSLGAPGVGRNEVKKQLLTNSPQSFVTTVPRKILS